MGGSEQDGTSMDCPNRGVQSENSPCDTTEETCSVKPDISAAVVEQRPLEGIEMPFIGPVLCRLYGSVAGSLRLQIRRSILKWEKGPLFSRTIRAIFGRYYGVHIGMYSGKGCFVPHNFRNETIIGRYCTIYNTAKAFNANHAMNLKSSSALFYNSLFALTDRDLIERTSLAIGNDVFIGHNAIILPPVHGIGDGAVIGAGAVVNQDVPPYAVVTGNPARVVRFRFPPDVIDELLREQWWNKPVEQLRTQIDQFTTPLDNTGQVR
jgi:acetyltransferase-like isoleucine patch superfamily enzyme